MKEIKLTTVYIPVTENDILADKVKVKNIQYLDKDFILSEQESVVFTQEEFNTFLEEYGKELLLDAYKNAKIGEDKFNMISENVDKQSITEVLPTVMEKYKV